jgi:polyphosphate kinase 2 (PPK2 family)
MASSEKPSRPEDWYDYLVDSLEVVEAAAALPGSRPVAPAELDDETIRRYFQENLHPYAERLDLKSYYRQKHALQVELVKLQNWVKETAQRLVVVFEGRDAAGGRTPPSRFRPTPCSWRAPGT